MTKPKNSHKLTITMPYNEFDSYVTDREKYNELKKSLVACFEIPTDKTQPIIVKTKELRDIARQFIGFNTDNCTFIDN